MGELDDIALGELDALEGSELAGRFRLTRMLGRGGYGAVFEAEQLSVNRRCAVKVLVPHVAADPRNTKRFEREAHATSRLAHPNTVVIYDFGLDEPRRLLFLAMEFIEGQSLREIIRGAGTLELTRALWIAHQAARSLQDAHDRGLVHRDVKPHNIMVTRRGGDPDFVKVIDFGIARFLGAEAVRESLAKVTATGTVVGTPSYMAPEQVRNAPLDGRTDQYALATCIYEMLTGRTVFVGDSPIDIATRQLTRRPVPIRTLNPALDVTEEFEQTLLRALAKEPDDRFDSIRTFADRLFDTAGVTPPFSIDTAERERESGAGAESFDFEPVDPTAATPVIGVASPPVEAPGEPPPDDVPGNTVAVTPGSSTSTEPSESTDPLAPADRWTMGRGAPVETVTAERPRRGARGVVWVVLSAAVVTAGLAAFVVNKSAEPPASPKPEPATVSPPASPKSRSSSRPPVPEDDQPETEVGQPETEDGQPATKERQPATEKRGAEPARRQPADRPDTVSDDSIDEPSPPPGEPAVVTVTLVPWGELWVNGKRRSRDPRTRLQLPPGRHRLELRQNGTARASKTVDVGPGQSKMIELIAR